MKIIVDAFGGDNAPLAILQGSRMAADAYSVEILLVGDEEKIKACAAGHQISLAGMEIHHAPDVLGMHEDPTEILRSKSQSSMAVAMQLLADGAGDAVVSAGSTGGVVVGATFTVKRLKGIKRPAIAVCLPTLRGYYLLCDAGANAECRPEMLEKFGLLGSIYAQHVLGIDAPKVGLINIGAEDSKGGQLQLDAYALLQQAPIRFIGNVEARELNNDACDVAVCDGFTGNVVLKLTEGLAKTIMSLLKGAFQKNLRGKLAALLLMPNLKDLKKTMDYTETGGAMILGVSKPVIKAHGNSKPKAFMNAIRQARDCVAADVTGKMAVCLQEMQTAGKEKF